MATARAFGYNLNDAAAPLGSTNYGKLTVNAPSNGDFAGSGIPYWYMGPDEDISGYIIAYADVPGNHTQGDQGSDGTPGSVKAYVGFKRVTTGAEFIAAAEELSGQDFLTASAARTYLLQADTDFWTNWPNSEAPGGNEPTNLYTYWRITACGGVTQFLMKAPEGAAFTLGEGYDLQTVIISDGEAPDNHIVVVSEGDSNAIPDFTIGSIPPQLECTA